MFIHGINAENLLSTGSKTALRLQTRTDSKSLDCKNHILCRYSWILGFRSQAVRAERMRDWFENYLELTYGNVKVMGGGTGIQNVTF